MLKHRIIQFLKLLQDPESEKDIIAAKVVQNLSITERGDVSLILEVKSSFMREGVALKEKIESFLKSLPGTRETHIVLTTQRQESTRPFLKRKIPGISYILAVGSGKGGVGKSTTAVNVAYALSTLGLKIGILDADIYGPSLPRLLGVNRTPLIEEETWMLPLEHYGLKVMSIGFLIPEEKPVIWRGPMIQKALHQMMWQVKWGNLDILIIDLPPGTGDVPLALGQNVLLAGALIVSTPQDLALIEACKGIEMFKKMEVPLVGLVENMSYFLCPHCQGRAEIFDHGGVRQAAEKLGIPFLGEVSLNTYIRQSAEEGMPVGLKNPCTPEAQAYESLATKIWAFFQGPSPLNKEFEP